MHRNFNSYPFLGLVDLSPTVAQKLDFAIVLLTFLFGISRWIDLFTNRPSHYWSPADFGSACECVNGWRTMIGRDRNLVRLTSTY